MCVGRVRISKDNTVGNGSPVRRNMDGDIHDVRIGSGFKLSVFCCFYVLFVQVLVLGFNGAALIREEAYGKSVDWPILLLPAAQGLSWVVLSFSVLHCKFNESEKFPFLLRFWWFLSFVICLCTLYVDGRGILVDGSKQLSSHAVANFAVTPSMAFLCSVAIRGREVRDEQLEGWRRKDER